MVQLSVLSLLIALLVGLASVVFVHLFPVVRYISSPEWFKSTRILFGPVLLAVTYAQVWALFWDTKRLDDVAHAQWARRGKKGALVTFSDKPFQRLAMLLFVPLMLWWFYAAIAFTWLPMASLVITSEPIEYKFVVKELRTPSRGPNSLMFQDHHWTFGGIPRANEFLVQRPQRGDMVRLIGKGNRWGMF